MEEIKLSIVIPHYNSAVLLSTLLKSIPNVPEIQVIVVDDYSNNELEELEKCKQEFKDSNVEFYVNENKKSAGGARNTGLKYVKGEWLLFADADDYFLPGFYDIIRQFFEREFDIVYFSSTSIDLETKKISDRHIHGQKLVCGYLNNPTKKNFLRLKYHYFSPCAKLIKRELFDQYEIKFDEVLVANDVMCSIKLAYHAKNVGAFDEVIYCITKQSGTLTTIITEERFDARMEVFYNRCQYLKENLPKDEYKLMRFGARARLQQIKREKFGTKKYISVLVELLRRGVPVWREYSLSYYYDHYCEVYKELKLKYKR